MRKIHNFDQISLLLVLIKHKWLFLASFTLCFILGSLFIFSLKNQSYTPPEQESPTQKTAFLKVAQYKQIAIPEVLINDILKSFKHNGLIDDFRLYTKTKPNKDDYSTFNLYAIFYETTQDDPMDSILHTLQNHPIIKHIGDQLDFYQAPELDNDIRLFARSISKDGFFSTFTNEIPPTSFNGAPINKHYIYLDKDRISQKGYHIDSTQIIKGHQSLNTNKIWVFLLISSIMVALFVVFSFESLRSILSQLKKAQNLKL